MSTFNTIAAQSMSVTNMQTMKGKHKQKGGSLVNLKQSVSKPSIGKVTTIDLHRASKYSG